MMKYLNVAINTRKDGVFSFSKKALDWMKSNAHLYGVDPAIINSDLALTHHKEFRHHPMVIDCINDLGCRDAGGLLYCDIKIKKIPFSDSLKYLVIEKPDGSEGIVTQDGMIVPVSDKKFSSITDE